MKILLTNDDGIYAKGLWILYRVLKERHDVSVIAPDRERSAVSHGITLHRPLRISTVEISNGCSGYAVDGTPADCIKLALTAIEEIQPDLVISGPNPNPNVGVNIHYSGTVAAAREAALYGVAAISVSSGGQQSGNDVESAQFVRFLAESVMQKGLPFGTCLNVNIPDLPFDAISGVRISRQGLAPISEVFEKRIDPRDKIYYWSGPDAQNFEKHPDLDGCALAQDYISITPIQSDATDYHFLDELKLWEIAVKDDSVGIDRDTGGSRS